MKLINIKLIILIFLVSSINAFAVIDVIHLGSFGKGKSWQAKQFGEGSSKVCYAVSSPVSTSPEALNRAEHALMISNFVDDNTRHEISIDAGFTYKAKSMVEVLIGNNKYKFFSMENRSWLADGQNGKQLIKDMKNGARVKVKSVSSRGTKITDTFSLIGFTKALAAIDKACS
jgi:hypothetical protein